MVEHVWQERVGYLAWALHDYKRPGDLDDISGWQGFHVLVLGEHLMFQLQDVVQAEFVLYPRGQEPLLDEQIEHIGHGLKVLGRDRVVPTLECLQNKLKEDFCVLVTILNHIANEPRQLGEAE